MYFCLHEQTILQKHLKDKTVYITIKQIKDTQWQNNANSLKLINL